MSNSLPEFLATAIPKAAADLKTAIERLPEDKRGWSPMGDARTALDQMAECAIINGGIPELLRTKTMGDFNREEYATQKKSLAEDWTTLVQTFDKNTQAAADAVRSVSDADLDTEVSMPWGPMSVARIISLPYWNMCYHEGQINYIASMLGLLK